MKLLHVMEIMDIVLAALWASSLISETNSACDLLLFPALGIIDQSGSPLLSDTLYFVIAELVAFEIEIPMNPPHIFIFSAYILTSIMLIHLSGSFLSKCLQLSPNPQM